MEKNNISVSCTFMVRLRSVILARPLSDGGQKKEKGKQIKRRAFSGTHPARFILFAVLDLLIKKLGERQKSQWIHWLHFVVLQHSSRKILLLLLQQYIFIYYSAYTIPDFEAYKRRATLSWWRLSCRTMSFESMSWIKSGHSVRPQVSEHQSINSLLVLIFLSFFFDSMGWAAKEY